MKKCTCVLSVKCFVVPGEVVGTLWLHQNRALFRGAWCWHGIRGTRAWVERDLNAEWRQTDIFSSRIIINKSVELCVSVRVCMCVYLCTCVCVCVCHRLLWSLFVVWSDIFISSSPSSLLCSYPYLSFTVFQGRSQKINNYGYLNIWGELTTVLSFHNSKAFIWGFEPIKLPTNISTSMLSSFSFLLISFQITFFTVYSITSSY